MPGQLAGRLVLKGKGLEPAQSFSWLLFCLRSWVQPVRGGVPYRASLLEEVLATLHRRASQLDLSTSPQPYQVRGVRGLGGVECVCVTVCVTVWVGVWAKGVAGWGRLGGWGGRGVVDWGDGSPAVGKC